MTAVHHHSGCFDLGRFLLHISVAMVILPRLALTVGHDNDHLCDALAPMVLQLLSSDTQTRVGVRPSPIVRHLIDLPTHLSLVRGEALEHLNSAGGELDAAHLRVRLAVESECVNHLHQALLHHIKVVGFDRPGLVDGKHQVEGALANRCRSGEGRGHVCGERGGERSGGKAGGKRGRPGSREACRLRGGLRGGETGRGTGGVRGRERCRRESCREGGWRCSGEASRSCSDGGACVPSVIIGAACTAEVRVLAATAPAASTRFVTDTTLVLVAAVRAVVTRVRGWCGGGVWCRRSGGLGSWRLGGLGSRSLGGLGGRDRSRVGRRGKRELSLLACQSHNLCCDRIEILKPLRNKNVPLVRCHLLQLPCQCRIVHRLPQTDRNNRHRMMTAVHHHSGCFDLGRFLLHISVAMVILPRLALTVGHDNDHLCDALAPMVLQLLSSDTQTRVGVRPSPIVRHLIDLPTHLSLVRGEALEHLNSAGGELDAAHLRVRLAVESECVNHLHQALLHHIKVVGFDRPGLVDGKHQVEGALANRCRSGEGRGHVCGERGRLGSRSSCRRWRRGSSLQSTSMSHVRCRAACTAEVRVLAATAPAAGTTVTNTTAVVIAAV